LGTLIEEPRQKIDSASGTQARRRAATAGAMIS
jgi:hypothetical protein